MENAVEQLSQVSGIKGVIICGYDGLSISFKVSDSEKEADQFAEEISASFSEIYNNIQTSLARFDETNLSTIYLETEKYKFLAKILNDLEMILVTVAEKDARLGLVLLELEDAVKKIMEEE